MKSYEIESFLKSFIIFFLLLEILLGLNFWHEYDGKKLHMEEKIRTEMKLCAFTVQCDGLQTDFVDKGKNKEENILYKDGDFYSYFSVPTVEKYLMKVTYPKERYLARIKAFQIHLEKEFLLYSLFAALVSLLFSVFSLRPLHRALRLNEEFVKDILHDFNTPLSSMTINLKLLKREVGKNVKIERLENNIESILALQNNLQTFLRGTQTQVDEFDMRPLIHRRILYFELLYPDVSYHVDVTPFRIRANRDAFVRIMDNLLSNAGKYNKKEGKVYVILQGTQLVVKDTGKGIAEPSKVFKRYYKEQDRGIGLGMHIVKKLCDEMHIGIKIRSDKGKGTQVILDIARLMA